MSLQKWDKDNFSQIITIHRYHRNGLRPFLNSSLELIEILRFIESSVSRKRRKESLSRLNGNVNPAKNKQADFII